MALKTTVEELRLWEHGKWVPSWDRDRLLADALTAHELQRQCAELEVENKKLKPLANGWNILQNSIEALADAGCDGGSTGDEKLNAYIEAWTKQRNRMAELEARVAALEAAKAKN